MVRHIDIHAMDIVLYARAAPIFHGVHGTVYHDLRAEGIMAGHSDHTDRYLFAAGGKPLRIAAAALCACLLYTSGLSVEALGAAGDKTADDGRQPLGHGILLQVLMQVAQDGHLLHFGRSGGHILSLIHIYLALRETYPGSQRSFR